MNFLQKLFTSPAAIFKFAIAIGYIALGTYLFFNGQLLYFIDKIYRYVLEAAFLAYGAFRLYRAFNDLKNE